MKAFGSIYVHDGATAQTGISTAVKLTGFATEGESSYDVHGGALITPDAANDQIAVKAGHTYKITFNLSLLCSAAQTVQVHARHGTTEIEQVAAQHLFGANATEHLGASGFYRATSDGNISLYIEADGSSNVTPKQGQLLVEQMD